MQLLDHEGLVARGIKKSPSQHRRNTADGKFPAPIKVGGRNAYIAEEIESYKRAELYKRDHPSVSAELSAWIKEQMKSGDNPWVGRRIDEWVEGRLKQGIRK
jgi:predicted DNA-binding transcriptional regulator AlpA